MTRIIGVLGSGVCPHLKSLHLTGESEVGMDQGPAVLLALAMNGLGDMPYLEELSFSLSRAVPTRLGVELAEGLGKAGSRIKRLYLGVGLGEPGNVKLAQVLREGGCPVLERLSIRRGLAAPFKQAVEGRTKKVLVNGE